MNGCRGAAASRHSMCKAHQACLSVCKLACDFNIVVTLLVALVGVGKVGTRVYCDLYTQRLYQTSKEYKPYWIYRVLLNAEEV